MHAAQRHTAIGIQYRIHIPINTDRLGVVLVPAMFRFHEERRELLLRRAGARSAPRLNAIHGNY